MKEIKLESDLRIKAPDKSLNEIKFIYNEIFKDYCYLKHGIAVNDGDTIFDVGANVGLFALSLARSRADLSIHAFEPTPPVFDCLKHNTAGVSGIKLIEKGLSDTAKQTPIVFLPKAPGNSTLYPHEKQAELRLLADEFQIRDLFQTDKLRASALLLF